LSVAADGIGHPAMRCAALLSRLATRSTWSSRLVSPPVGPRPDRLATRGLSARPVGS